ncbi:hypothetical protein NLJ89_g3685 [Agrocybe chaxingu]|uniref:Uncharacterized protein n=1 Tax=Agrocybe chaxingu TaxID=84603 RepID=A0A9W8K4C6_9AGAR|nr:hypothetical protein NLJ89_g3685 [Agrocybe chaxingu]
MLGEDNEDAGTVTLPSNQVFFQNTKKTLLIDSVFDLHDDAPPVKGRHGARISFGSGSTNFTMVNSVVQTYTGSGEGIDLNAFLNQTPLLPRAARAHQCGGRGMIGGAV